VQFNMKTVQKLIWLCMLSGAASSAEVSVTSRHPQVYDFRITPQWHQVVLYNTERGRETTVSVKLAGDTAEGALGLDPDKSWHVHDFWNDRYLGAVEQLRDLFVLRVLGECLAAGRVGDELHLEQRIGVEERLHLGLCLPGVAVADHQDSQLLLFGGGRGTIR